MPTGEWDRKAGMEEVVEGTIAHNEDPTSGLQEQAIDCMQHQLTFKFMSLALSLLHSVITSIKASKNISKNR